MTVVLLTNGCTSRFDPEDLVEQVAAMYVPELLSPVASLREHMHSALDENDLQGALSVYKKIVADVDLNTEWMINRLGYRMLERKRVNEAVAVFKLNTARYPKSGNAYDSLGEAYLEAGQKELARENYRQSLALDPNNDNARRVLADLSKR